MPTVKQIAKMAGVSIGTVSNVLNELPSVRETTRKRVLSVIDSLGYQPSLLGRALRKDRTNMIVMIVPDITNPFFPSVVRGAEDVAYQNDYRLILCNSDNDYAKESTYLRELQTYRPSGLIIDPADLSKGQEEALKYINAGSAVVYLDRIPPRWRGDAVTSAHEEGAYEATKHLISLGHKNIATIAGPLQSTSAAQRLAGFQRAMKEARLPVPTEYVQASNFNSIGGCEKAEILLKLRTRPTAIFAANDMIAFGAIRATRKAGLSCPEDISIVGFDNLEMDDEITPALSTVDQFASELGARAVQIVINRLIGDKSSAKHICIPTCLRLRDSTRELRKASGRQKASTRNS
jgi:LacI family transcriptional regulator, galactose operon repressor